MYKRQCLGCGADFKIANDNIYVGFTYVDDTESTFKIAAYSLGRSPRFLYFDQVSLTEGTAYDQTVSANGDPIPTIASSVTTGTLPTGLTLSGGRLHGTPTNIPTEGVNFTITFTATNSRGTTTEQLIFTVSGT